MKSCVVAASLTAFVAVAVAQVVHQPVGNPKHQAYIRRRDAVERRQASSVVMTSSAAPSPSAAPVSGSVASPSLPAATGVSGSVSGTISSAAPVNTTPTVDGNEIPPLAQITSNAPVETPLSMFTTFAAGATPPISGAPPLPSITALPANYPALDQVPPTNSDLVQQWMQELNGADIPDLQPTTDGSCASDPVLAANQTRCWWTCGQCTRPTDITVCPEKDTWGLSFDDGPSPYTPKLVNFLNEKDLLATFFTVGSRVISRPQMLQTEWMLGHQLSVHTWSHPPLTSLTTEQIVAELGWTRKVIKDVLGVTPTTMRPPYGDIDDRVRAIALAMGMTPIIWTVSGQTEFDTKDWRIAGGTANGTSSYAAWQTILNATDTLDTGFITLEHDLYQQSVDMAIGYFLPDALTHDPPFTLQPIIDCLGQPAGNAYLETNPSFAAQMADNKTANIAQPGAASDSTGSSSGSSPSSTTKSKSGALESVRIGGVAVLTVALGLIGVMML